MANLLFLLSQREHRTELQKVAKFSQKLDATSNTVDDDDEDDDDDDDDGDDGNDVHDRNVTTEETRVPKFVALLPLLRRLLKKTPKCGLEDAKHYGTQHTKTPVRVKKCVCVCAWARC